MIDCRCLHGPTRHACSLIRVYKDGVRSWIIIFRPRDPRDQGVVNIVAMAAQSVASLAFLILAFLEPSPGSCGEKMERLIIVITVD